MDVIEVCCRAMCIAENVNPDLYGTACTKETRERLGDSYPLWKYRIPYVEAVLIAYKEYNVQIKPESNVSQPVCRDNIQSEVQA